jgi:hypothetical protein
MADNYLERQYELLQARKAQLVKKKAAEAKKRAREREKAKALADATTAPGSTETHP